MGSIGEHQKNSLGVPADGSSTFGHGAPDLSPRSGAKSAQFSRRDYLTVARPRSHIGMKTPSARISTPMPRNQIRIGSSVADRRLIE